jgi:hypothetical protein
MLTIGGAHGPTRILRLMETTMPRTCVDAPSDASGFLATVEHVVRCGRVSGLEDAALVAAGLYGDMQIGTISLTRARRHFVRELVRPIRSRDRLPLGCLRPAHILDVNPAAAA